ncbi:GNAT family N-acetyltransferase [Kutzneria kofuensis]|jgi:GNAT superfamily N-acetyltransferase|uniref:GNAT superfamily N-acetyltransferase n=1 Tax=Kutzneria kofuensis TaxID=103725 RepID=A0A7W9NEE4_9PSEU|nr:GNAT family N-acetyltransferase [Kutzneria kofuensis]MBB5888863.1 GNAT superfamily N-acetyltransferase [Kutzneria kofuensis]
MVDLEIHPVRLGEAPALEARGQAGYVHDRLARQDDGRGVFLAAWRGDLAVGSVYLWLEPAEEAEIREHLPETPLITHLEVFAGSRNQGIGTRLVEAAEQVLRDRHYTTVALAVELSNVDAERLYKRLGYQDWGFGRVDCIQREWLPDDTLLETREECTVLVKLLG